MKKHIVVIGGGMAGCAAAYSLHRRGYKVTIVEQDNRLGGRMYSEKVEDLTFEMGAVFLTGFYTNVLSFLRETGLDKNLQIRKSESSIVRKGTPFSIKQWSTYFENGWLSVGAKLLLIKEVMKLLPVWSRLQIHGMWRADSLDTQSVAERFSGKYGRELLNYLFEPVLGGYMYWSPARTSQAFLMILFKATLLHRRTYILKNGLQQIPERAVEGSEVLLSYSVTQVKRDTEDGKYTITTRSSTGEQALTADGIVCATTASVVPRIFSSLTTAQTAFFSSISYSSTAVATYRFERPLPMVTYAIAYPRVEKQPIAAMTVQSDTSSVASVVKVYASGDVGKGLDQKSDKEIHNLLAKPVSLNLKTAVINNEWRVQRWQEALPEFNVGHLRKLRAFANGEIEVSGSKVVFAGDYIGGPFVEGAFTSGVEAATRLHGQF